MLEKKNDNDMAKNLQASLCPLLFFQLDCARQVADKEEELESIQRELETAVEQYEEQITSLNSEVG